MLQYRISTLLRNCPQGQLDVLRLKRYAAATVGGIDWGDRRLVYRHSALQLAWRAALVKRSPNRDGDEEKPNRRVLSILAKLPLLGPKLGAPSRRLDSPHEHKCSRNGFDNNNFKRGDRQHQLPSWGNLYLDIGSQW